MQIAGALAEEGKSLDEIIDVVMAATQAMGEPIVINIIENT